MPHAPHMYAPYVAAWSCNCKGFGLPSHAWDDNAHSSAQFPFTIFGSDFYLFLQLTVECQMGLWLAQFGAILIDYSTHFIDNYLRRLTHRTHGVNWIPIPRIELIPRSPWLGNPLNTFCTFWTFIANNRHLTVGSHGSAAQMTPTKLTNCWFCYSNCWPSERVNGGDYMIPGTGSKGLIN